MVIDGNQFITSVRVVQGEVETTSSPKDDKSVFDQALKETILPSKFLNSQNLEAKGWKKEAYMDMNGGQYYTDPKSGMTVRVLESRIFGEGKSMSMKTDKMAHFATFDNNGKETGGVIQIKQDDGSIKIYDYEVDIEGNKFIKSVNLSEYDDFVECE